MKKIIICLIAIIAIILLGWMFKDTETQNINASTDRFITIQDWGNNKVVYDSETKVEYYIFCANGAGGITVLVDENGKPLLYRGK